MIVLAKDSGIGMILLGAGLIYFLSRKKNQTDPWDQLEAGRGAGYGGGGGGARADVKKEDPGVDPLAASFSAKRTRHISKKTGAVTIGMYTKPRHIKANLGLEELMIK